MIEVSPEEIEVFRESGPVVPQCLRNGVGFLPSPEPGSFQDTITLYG